MKKFTILFSLLVVAALVLTACGGANNNVDGTPGADVVTTPGLGETPITGGDVDVTPTLAVTDVVLATPTAAIVDATATPAAGVDTTPVVGETGTAEVPVTGDNDDCNPNLMTAVLDYEVMDAESNVVGEVDAIVIFRDASSDLGAVVTDDAGAVTPAATPEATLAAGTVDTDMFNGVDVTALNAADYANARIAYLIVDLDDAGDAGDQDVLVPFSYFRGGSVPEENFMDCDYNVSGELSDLQGAPTVADNEWPDFNIADWDADLRTYWTGLGTDVNFVDESGAELGNAVVVQDNFDDIDVRNTNGDDIGEIEDFVIDPATGQFNYAILAAGGFLGLGEKLIPVPMQNMLWGNFDDDGTDLGEIVINISDEQWQNAPSLDNLSDVDFTDDTWATEYDAFWQTVTPNTTP